MSDALATHRGPADYSPGPNPACHLFLFYWITATPIHLLTVYGRLRATIVELSSCDRDH